MSAPSVPDPAADPIAELIARLRDGAKWCLEERRYAIKISKGALLIFSRRMRTAANALQALVDDAPCVADIGTPRTNWIECTQPRRVHGPGLGQVDHAYEPPAWFDAALTRAAKGDG